MNKRMFTPVTVFCTETKCSKENSHSMIQSSTGKEGRNHDLLESRGRKYLKSFADSKVAGVNISEIFLVTDFSTQRLCLANWNAAFEGDSSAVLNICTSNTKNCSKILKKHIVWE